MKFLLLFLSFVYANLPYCNNAICYGPFRDGQRPGGENPTVEQLTEDLEIMTKHWSVIRMYGSRGSTEKILDIIDKNKIKLKIYLGAWIANESDSIASIENKKELDKAIELANKYPEIIEAVIIGNETQVFWTWNKVDLKIIKEYIIKVKSAVTQPVSTADDFNFWNTTEGAEIAEFVDFIFVHIHPLWAGLELDKAVDSQIDTLFPNKQTIIGETGWATKVHNKGEQSKLIKGIAGEKEQASYYKNINTWSKKNEVTIFFFEVFDENWKGGDHPNEVEKHWGVYNANRIPKYIFK